MHVMVKELGSDAGRSSGVYFDGSNNSEGFVQEGVIFMVAGRVTGFQEFSSNDR